MMVEYALHAGQRTDNRSHADSAPLTIIVHFGRLNLLFDLQ